MSRGSQYGKKAYSASDYLEGGSGVDCVFWDNEGKGLGESRTLELWSCKMDAYSFNAPASSSMSTLHWKKNYIHMPRLMPSRQTRRALLRCSLHCHSPRMKMRSRSSVFGF